MQTAADHGLRVLLVLDCELPISAALHGHDARGRNVGKLLLSMMRSVHVYSGDVIPEADHESCAGNPHDAM